MNPQIYVYEEQLREILATGDPGPFKCVAFGWAGENVYHVHIAYPKVTPSGYPSVAIFKISNTEETFRNAHDDFEVLLATTSQGEDSHYKTVIGIYLYQGIDKLHHSAFRKTSEGIAGCDVTYVPAKSELYSRSKGLLEVDILEHKKVLIIGLGSFGSQIAVELAKAGTGNVALVDFDRIELSNISRHICGVNELGRLKTHAVRDAILVKNPFANVTTFETDISKNHDLLMQLVQDTDLVICATDNNRSRFNINETAFGLDKPVIYGRAVTRAEGGDVFQTRGSKGPCYNCLIGVHSLEEEISSLSQTETLPAYTLPAEKQAMVQVGLSSDIMPICNMMVKLALIELSKGCNSGISSLETELTYDYYFWANRREKNYLRYQPFNNSKMQPTILRWYGVKVPPQPDCAICSNAPIE